MKYILICIVVVYFFGCGVKGAPMPRKDKVFIKPSEVKKTLIKIKDVKQEPIKKKEKK